MRRVLKKNGYELHFTEFSITVTGYKNHATAKRAMLRMLKILAGDVRQSARKGTIYVDDTYYSIQSTKGKITTIIKGARCKGREESSIKARAMCAILNIKILKEY